MKRTFCFMRIEIKGCPMSLILTFPWIRRNLRGEPDQLNTLSSPIQTVEKGSKVGMIIKVL
jgi:hypothetical protein